MDNTGTTEQQFAPIPEPVIALDAQSRYYLTIAGKWATFLGIVGFIGTGFILLAAVFIGTILTYVAHLSPSEMGVPTTEGAASVSSILGAASGIVSFIYVLLAVVSFFVAYYLYRFGSGIKKSLLYNDTIAVTKSLGYLKSYFKLIGIITIVVLAFYVIIFAFTILGGLVAASAMH